VVAIKLKGLNITRGRGKWYVYHRASGKPLVRGFVGTKDDLKRHLGTPEAMAAYNRVRNLAPDRTYGSDTLGGLVKWFTTEYPKWLKLAEATRSDYKKAFDYLRDEFDISLSDITQPDLYNLRDKCATQKWPRFADKMIAALSSMFSQAVKRGKMTHNPAAGMEKGHRADPNANREWSAAEWADARRLAPPEVLTPMMLARYAGFRGQTIAKLAWKTFQDDPDFGKCFRHTAKKNDERAYVPVVAELRAYLDGLTVRHLELIAVRDDGSPWESEKDLQTRVSHFLRSIQGTSALEPGATLHGLRVTYAAELKRKHGATDDGVAAALGDRSERMGKHYTRHVENEAKVIRAFGGKANPDKA
jgi:hypothetical protein